MNRHGLTIIEALAGILILSIVMVSTMTILVNTRIQSKATERYLAASQVGIMLSNYTTVYMNDDTNKMKLESFMADKFVDDEIAFTSSTCLSNFTESFCTNLYNRPSVGGLDFNEDNVIITIAKPSGAPNIIRFTFRIIYYNERTTEIEAFIYV